MTILKTIGTGAGYDYSGYNAACNALRLLTIGDDYEISIEGNFIEDVVSDVQFNSEQFTNGIDPNGHTITFKNDGLYICTQKQPVYFYNAGSINGDIIVENPIMNIDSSFPSGQCSIFCSVNNAVASVLSVVRIEDAKIFCNSIAGFGMYAITANNYEGEIDILNPIVCQATIMGIYLTGCSGSLNTFHQKMYLQNGSIINCSGRGYSFWNKNLAAYVEIKNCAAYNNTGGDYVMHESGSWTDISITFCGDSDDTLPAAGRIVSDILDTDFLSVDSTDSDFSKINSSSQLYGIGTLSLGVWNNHDAAGNPRPDASSKASIGAYELTVTAFPGKKITLKTLLGFKLENEPYVAETLVAADYTFHAYDVKVAPFVESFGRFESRGDFSCCPSVAGRRSLAINFTVDLYAHPTVTTAPGWFKMLRACGWRQVAHGSTGISIRPGTAREPATIEVAFEDESDEPRQLVYKVAGAMGYVKFSGAVGRPISAEFSFLGRLEGITTRSYANRITASTFDAATPPALLGANVIVAGRSALLDAFEIASNEAVNLFSDIFRSAGFGGALVADRLIAGKITIGGIMSLVVTHIGGVVAIGYDSTTGERGFLTKLMNGTGTASVKGSLVAMSASADNQVVLQNNELDTVGVVAEAGVADGSEMWVWKSGSKAQVLYKDSTAATRGYLLLAADTDGRAIDVAVPTSNPVVAQHFKECGHVCESKDAGTGVLVLADLHFN